MRKVLGLVRCHSEGKARRIPSLKCEMLRLWLSMTLFCVMLCSSVFSATPSKIKYQGVLKEKGVLVNGAKTMMFRITNSDGLTEHWTSGDVSVTATQGAFSYELAVSTSIDWKAGGYYLEVTIGGQILSPREEIASTVYALQARDIDDGIVTSAKIADGAVTTSKIADSTVTAGKLNQASVSTVFLTTSAAINNSNSVNSPANVISWNQIKDMPLVFADGTDDGTGASLDSVGSYHIIDSTITNADINDVAWSKLTGVPAGFADGTDDTGGTLGANSIGSYHIIDSTITNADINDVAWSKLTGVPAGFADGTDSGETGALASSNTITNATTDPALKILQSGATNAILIQQTATVPAIQVAGGGLLFTGAVGAIPATGAGTRLMWYPAKYAFRAGYVNGTQWNDTPSNTAGIGDYSFACGGNTISSNTASVAMGYGTKAGGVCSTAMGDSTTASGDKSTAFGEATKAGGVCSTAMGYNTKANNDYAVAMGYNTTASGLYSTVVGNTSIASGQDSTAIGQNVTAGSASNTIAIGKSITNNIAGSLMIGFGTSPGLFVSGSSVAVNSTTIPDGPAFYVVGDSTFTGTLSVLGKITGDGSGITGLGATADAGCRESTGTIQNQLNLVATSTGTLVKKDTTNSSDTNPALKILQTGATNAILIQQSATVPAIQVAGGGLLFTGTVGAIPVEGAGTRLMWYPAKYAFRAGQVTGTQWNDTPSNTAGIGNYSFACGGNTISSNTASVAMGFGTWAGGQYSTALGASSKAGGDYSTALGDSSRAGGIASTAMGNLTLAYGDYSTATGRETTAGGYASTAMGYKTKALTTYSTAMGRDTTAIGSASTAMGNGSSALADYSTAIGSAVVTSGSNWSVGIGQDVKSTAANNIVIGKGDASNNFLVNNTANSLAVGFNTTNPMFTVSQSSVVVNGVLGVSSMTASQVNVNNASANAGLNILQTGATNAILIQQSATVPAIQAAGGGLLFTGAVGAIPATGAGTRLMWYPAKGAFRAGYVESDRWDEANIGNFSTAMGYDTKALGQSSTAMGQTTTASGAFSTAMGYLTSAAGSQSTAIGANVTNNTANSFMVGFNAAPTFTVFSSSVQINGAAGSSADILVISTGTDANNESFRFQGNGQAYGKTWATTGADYAEWFEKEENGIKSGDIVGLNVKTKKARKYISGDVLIGICSSKPGFVGNGNIDKTDEAMKLDYVLVGLVGQLDFNKEQINIIDEIKVETKDGKQLGYLLSTGKVLVKSQ